MEQQPKTERKVKKIVRPSSSVPLFQGLSSSVRNTQQPPKAPTSSARLSIPVSDASVRPSVNKSLAPIPTSVAVRTTEQPTPSISQTSLSRVQPAAPPSLRVQPPAPSSLGVQPPAPSSLGVQPPAPPSLGVQPPAPPSSEVQPSPSLNLSTQMQTSKLNPDAQAFVPPPPTTSYNPSCEKYFDVEKAYAEISALDDPMDKMEYRDRLCKYDRKLLGNREQQELVVLPLPKEKGEFSPRTPTDSPPKHYSIHSVPFTQYKKVDGRYYTATEAEKIKKRVAPKKKMTKQKQIQKEREEQEEFLEKIQLTNFPKKNKIISTTNKFNSLLNLNFNTDKPSLTNGLLGTFDEFKKTTFSQSLETLKNKEYEVCSSDVCKLWNENQYLDIISSEGKKEVKFLDNNIFITLIHQGNKRTIKISKYFELNLYLKNLRKELNREFLEDSQSSKSANLDKKIEIIYTALHKIHANNTNTLNTVDNVSEILTNLYIQRKSSYLSESKDEWKRISEMYASQQKKLNQFELDNKPIIEPPVALLNNKFYIILQNPQIVS